MARDCCATILSVRLVAASLAVVALLQAPLGAQDALAEARRLYNASQYEAAERPARIAVAAAATANSARLVLGRILLERFRESASDAHLSEGRALLREVRPSSLDARERIEWMLGIGEGLFLEDRFGAAAETFEPIIASSSVLGAAAHEQVLDWWASALDQYASSRPVAERPSVYARITARMSSELERDPGCGPANYWLAAAARGAGETEIAWSRAISAWVRAPLARDHGAALRADLDRLVLHALIAERAAKLTGREAAQAVAALSADWEAFKAAWTK